MRFLIAIFLSMIVLPLQAKNLLTWYAYHQPPAYIFKGEYQGLGFANLSLQLLINALPQYQHSEIQVSVGRAMHDMKLGKNVCGFGIYPTKERKKHLVFSDDALMNRNVNVVIKTELAERLSLTAPVNLAELFSHHQLSTNIIDGRSYGTYIDNLVTKYPENVFLQSAKSDTALYQMLERNRFDFMLTYPSSANYAIETRILSSQYSILKIKGLTPFLKAGVACSNSEWGKQVISDVNLALKTIKSSNSYFNALSSWSKNNNDHEDFRRFYYSDFLKNTTEKPTT